MDEELENKKSYNILMSIAYFLSGNFIIMTGVVVGVPALVKVGVGDIEMILYILGIMCFAVVLIINGIDHIYKLKSIKK